MFSNLFNYDNKVWRFIGKFADIILLNILWLICSLPVFTVGASTAAVYYVTLKLAADEDSYTVRSFFKSFRQNFKQATVIWLIMAALGAILVFDFLFTLRLPVSQTAAALLQGVFLAMMIIYLAVMIYIFPVQARFYNTVKGTILNAFYMSVRHLPRTIAIAVIDIGAVALAIALPQVLMLFFIFGFPLLAFINSYILLPVFKKYSQKTEGTDGGQEG